MSKSKKVKARKVWEVRSLIMQSDAELFAVESYAKIAVCACETGNKAATIRPVFVIPADAASYDAMVEQMWFAQGHLTHAEVKRQLAAIGITRPSNKEDGTSKLYQPEYPVRINTPKTKKDTAS